MPHHTAANEGAIAALFSMLRVQLERELDTAGMEGEDEPTLIRKPDPDQAKAGPHARS